MTISPQSLMNMEMMLYGGKSYSQYAPSMYNNYLGRTYDNSIQNNTANNTTNNSVFSNYLYPQGYTQNYNLGYTQNYATSFGQNIPSIYQTQQSSQQQAQSSTVSSNVFEGLNDNEKSALVGDYVKSMAPSESFGSAALGGTAFAVLFHPRAIIHPINTFKSFKLTDEVFADLKVSGTELAKAWAESGSNEILRNAYTAMNRIDARSLKKLTESGKKGFHIWREPFNPGEYEELKKMMVKALDAYKKNPGAETLQGIMDATEALNRANVKDGLLKKALNGIKNIFRKEKVKLPTALESAMNKPAEDVTAKGTIGQLLEKSSGSSAKETARELMKGKSYPKTLKTSGGGILGAIFFLGMEYLTSAGKIKECFKKDKKTGFKQLGQTTVKGAGSALGWAAGEALGVWGTAKILAAAGTAIAPGIGTAIGAIAGMALGSIGCWLAGKITNKIVGQDVGDKVQAENMAKTQEGQVQLLQNTMDRIQKGEKVDPQAQAAIQKLIAQYA